MHELIVAGAPEASERQEERRQSVSHSLGCFSLLLPADKLAGSGALSLLLPRSDPLLIAFKLHGN